MRPRMSSGARNVPQISQYNYRNCWFPFYFETRTLLLPEECKLAYNKGEKSQAINTYGYKQVCIVNDISNFLRLFCTCCSKLDNVLCNREYLYLYDIERLILSDRVINSTNAYCERCKSTRLGVVQIDNTNYLSIVFCERLIFTQVLQYDDY